MVGVLEVPVGRLERDVRSRSCSVEETLRASGRGGKIPFSDDPDSSSSAPAGCPLTGSTDDGYAEPNVNRAGKEWGCNAHTRRRLWWWIRVYACMMGGPGDECRVVRVDVCSLDLDQALSILRRGA
jgi:hypothetical protein